jgi:hypothetical protein
MVPPPDSTHNRIKTPRNCQILVVEIEESCLLVCHFYLSEKKISIYVHLVLPEVGLVLLEVGLVLAEVGLVLLEVGLVLAEVGLEVGLVFGTCLAEPL